ncbi:MAG: hypothetical protein J5992_07760 [Oscillospiraceae bacterium]|nr:hypothetical protein [Oscillospiraceae bacterium]
MGWTSYHADFYKNGKVDRKAELDHTYNYENENQTVRVLKSSMVGSTYYAAVEVVPKNGEDRSVTAAVVLTSTDMKDWYNFSCKCMDETCGPGESECPKSILKLLTPTTYEYAKAWRKRCWDNLEKKNSPLSLGKLPVGTKISFVRNGVEIVLEKKAPNYQFKTTWWYRASNNTYFQKKYLPTEFTIVAD